MLGLTGSVAHPSIDLGLAGERAEDSRLREDTPGMEDDRRWHSWALEGAAPGPWLLLLKGCCRSPKAR
jgi:hypothetical protein